MAVWCIPLRLEVCGSSVGKSDSAFRGVAGQLLLGWWQDEGDGKTSVARLRLDKR